MKTITFNLSTFVCLVFATLSSETSHHDANHTVVTRNGAVRGKLMYTVDQNKPYVAYRGIPFARPPLGNLRFKDPQPPPRWRGVLDATQDKNKCVQILPAQGSEDCLYINVYVPQVAPSRGRSLLPVMVWIYGGRFVFGSSDYDSYGPDYLLDNEVVFVSFNYRLGIFGFLSTGDLAAPGNAGMKDMVLALRWVRENIASFGGDPQKVTAFGESAGGVGVSLLLQSPQAAGLFQAAIIQSCNSLVPEARSRRAKEYAEAVAKKLNLDTSTSQALVNGLRNVPYGRLHTVATELEDSWIETDGNPLNGIVNGPVVEHVHPGAFFTEHSYELLKSGRVTRIPNIIGFNSLEGYMLSGILEAYYGKNMDPVDLVPLGMNINNQRLLRVVGEKIGGHYPGLSPVALNNDSIIEYIGDDQFYRSMIANIHEYSKYAPVYFYELSYEGNLGVQGNRTHRGVEHAEDLAYLFRTPAIPTAKDVTTRLRMAKLWTNFAKHGHPTPVRDPLFNNVIWPETRSSKDDNLLYLDIGDNLEVKHNPKQRAWSFWRELFNDYGVPPFDTY